MRPSQVETGCEHNTGLAGETAHAMTVVLNDMAVPLELGQCVTIQQLRALQAHRHGLIEEKIADRDFDRALQYCESEERSTRLVDIAAEQGVTDAERRTLAADWWRVMVALGTERDRLLALLRRISATSPTPAAGSCRPRYTAATSARTRASAFPG
jgi:hypothetical protein